MVQYMIQGVGDDRPPSGRLFVGREAGASPPLPRWPHKELFSYEGKTSDIKELIYLQRPFFDIKELL